VEDGGPGERGGLQPQQTPTAQVVGKKSRNVMTCTTCNIQMFQEAKQMKT